MGDRVGGAPSAGGERAAQTGARVAIGRGITAVQSHFRQVFGLDDAFPVDGRQFDHLFADGDTFAVGALSGRVLASGHGVCGLGRLSPRSLAVDARLLGGAALFGVGWGLAEYCPGPALAGLGTAAREALWFVPAMLVGIAVQRVFNRGSRR